MLYVTLEICRMTAARNMICDELGMEYKRYVAYLSWHKMHMINCARGLTNEYVAHIA